MTGSRAPAASRAEAQRRWSPPEQFEEYRIHEPLGRGRTGRVYLAHDTLLERPVAVKFVHALDPDDLGRFLLEARAAARIQHPNVLTLYRVGQLDDRPFLVSEYVRGIPLDQLPRPVPWRGVVELGVQLARGLAAAHRAGVLHRDLKPSNAIVADSGEVKLLDFGLAKLVGERDLPRDESLLGDSGSSDDAISTLDLPSMSHRGLIGTPYFMAPEAWRGEVATAATDVYSLGVMLYELAAGKGPFRHVPLAELPQAVQAQRARSLLEVVPDADARFAAVVDRCVMTDPAARFPSADAVAEALEALVQSAASAPVPPGNPYRGLHAFQQEHRALFFGRARDARAVVERLRGRGLVVVTGDSGVGKSSLVLAGVLPELEEGAIDAHRRWRTAQLIPGGRPVLAAATALAPLVGVGEPEAEVLVSDDPQELLRRLRLAQGAELGTVLYVDQLEELVTLSDHREARAVARLLALLGAGVPGVRVAATARSDFLTRLAGLPGMREAMSPSLYLLAPLGAEEIREVIVGPARVKGARFETDAMVEALVSSTLGTDGGLPLLQFALAELWERRDPQSQVIGAAALDAMGGVEGALARHADGAVGALLPAERQEARRLLLRLVTLDGTRARRTADELVLTRPGAQVALEALIAARLVVARQTDAGAEYDLAHEALLRGWGTLARWLQEHAEARALHARVEQAALEWERLGRANEATWSQRQLAEASALDPTELAPRELAFLDASRRNSSRRRLLLRSSIALFVLALAGTYGGVQLRNRQVLAEQVAQQVAQADAALARARSEAAAMRIARQRAFDAFDAKNGHDGNTAWAAALEHQPAMVTGYVEASDALERALVLDPRRDEVRARFVELLAERAALEEEHLHFGERDALVQRLKLYDTQGTRVRRWTAPVQLTVRTDPAGAEVTIARYTVEQGVSKLGEARVLGTSPLTRVPLERGSYLLTFSAPGRAPVRYPLLADGSTTKTVELALPLAGEVPPGFVHVPAGSFLFGTGADESIRQFFSAVPLHAVQTGPYRIAVHEVTYRDYLEYLRALPEAERARRGPRPMPSTGASSLVPQIDLAPTASGRWRLRLKPGGAVLSALEGEPVRYPGRRQRAEQDWLRMPVGGIDFDDARAYAGWLHDTGRVPGARLCTEVEWERAARGADGREYPHGDRLTTRDANFDATYGKAADGFGPDEVGSWPRSRSPFGVDDLVGNVWEWVESSLEAGQPVARGGSYYFAASTCRSTNRELPARDFRDLSVGLRICADATR